MEGHVYIEEREQTITKNDLVLSLLESFSGLINTVKYNTSQLTIYKRNHEKSGNEH